MARSARACCAAGPTNGTRPTFELVTGVSTGALTAPFAYLGSSYDPQLRTVYTELTPDNVLKRRRFTAALFDDAMADNSPLFQTISLYLNEAMLAAIAADLRRRAPAADRHAPIWTRSSR